MDLLNTPSVVINKLDQFVYNVTSMTTPDLNIDQTSSDIFDYYNIILFNTYTNS